MQFFGLIIDDVSIHALKKDLLESSVRFVVTRILILAIGFICWTVFPERGQVYDIKHTSENADFKKVWNKFDSVWYPKLAKEGYPQRPFTNDTEETWGFMPLYPIAIYLLAKLSGLDLFYAGILASNIFALLGLFFLYRLAQEKFETGTDTLNMVLICAGSFFLNLVYAEGLFFFLSVLVFYLSHKKRFALAFFFAGLASITRIQGCLLFVIPAIDIIYTNFRTSYRYIPAAILGLTPMIAFMVYLDATCGEPLAFIKIQHAWGSTETYPLQGFVNLLTKASPGSSFMNASFWILIVAAVGSQYRRLPLSYLLFTLLYFMLSTSNEIVYGTTRYMLGVIPLFIAVPVSNKYVKEFFIVLNLMFLGVAIATFVTHTTAFL